MLVENLKIFSRYKKTVGWEDEDEAKMENDI